MQTLIVDVTSSRPTLTESKKRPGVYEVTGVMQRAEAKNQNGRVYKKPILEREVDNYVKLCQGRKRLWRTRSSRISDYLS